ncbi:MAG: ShlB/FhaC/HecB family hemolysin secretion/activation protein [Pasteurellaceae bacterium]|nr:ShlB/FhaC/HecB family hemolysin secretion/activation protein [Pasteurellaceae bacterium]
MKKWNSKPLSLILSAVFVSDFVHADPDPLVQESHRLKHQEVLEASGKALQKAETLLQRTSPSKKVSASNIDQHLPIIQKIRIDTANIIDSEELHQVIESYQGKNLTSAQIFEISQQLTEELYRHGYVTSAVGLKSVDVLEGDLQFIIHWGKVDQWLVNKHLPRSFKDKAMLILLPKFKGGVFNIHQLDQMIETLSTSNKSATVDVLSSEQNGKSHLNFNISRRLLPRIVLGFNMSGIENNANGRNQGTISLRMGDLLGTNDEWNISFGHRFYRQHKHNNQINYTIGYTQPFSFYRLETKLSQSHYKKTINGINGAYGSSGRSQTLTAKLSRLLFRDKVNILTAYSELEFKTRTNYLAHRKVLNRQENKFSIGLSYITHLWQGRLYSELSYANGLNWSGADALAYGSQGNKTLRILNGNVTWHKKLPLLGHETHYQLRIGGQYSGAHLYSDNQFSLGDEYTVRGFKGGAISAESGVYISQTMSLSFYPRKYSISQFTPSIGIDIGQVYPKGKAATQTIAGVSAGLNTTLYNHLSLSLGYARPLMNIKQRKNNSVYYFNGSISF